MDEFVEREGITLDGQVDWPQGHPPSEPGGWAGLLRRLARATGLAGDAGPAPLVTLRLHCEARSFEYAWTPPTPPLRAPRPTEVLEGFVERLHPAVQAIGHDDWRRRTGHADLDPSDTQPQYDADRALADRLRDWLGADRFARLFAAGGYPVD